MTYDFHHPTQTAAHTDISRSWSVVPVILLSIFVFCALLIFTVSFLSSLVVYRSEEANPYVLAFFQKDSDLSLLWVNEQKKELTLLPISAATAYSAHTVGTYPITSIPAVYAQANLDEDTLHKDLSLFFHVRVLQTYQITQKNPTRSALLFALAKKGAIRFFFVVLDPRFTLHTTTQEFAGQKNALGMQDFLHDQYSLWVEKNFPDSFGVRGTTLSIVNASGVAQAGRRMAATMTTLGFHVLSVTDGDIQDRSRALIFKDSEQTDPTHIFFRDFFSVPLERNESMRQAYRSDCVLIIGKDLGENTTP